VHAHYAVGRQVEYLEHVRVALLQELHEFPYVVVGALDLLAVDDGLCVLYLLPLRDEVETGVVTLWEYVHALVVPVGALYVGPVKMASGVVLQNHPAHVLELLYGIFWFKFFHDDAKIAKIPHTKRKSPDFSGLS
jgi:hypothetical protein